MKKIKILLLVAAGIILFLVADSMTMKSLPTPAIPQVAKDYNIVVSNTGYLIYKGDSICGYVDYTDTVNLTVIAKPSYMLVADSSGYRIYKDHAYESFVDYLDTVKYMSLAKFNAEGQ